MSAAATEALKKKRRLAGLKAAATRIKNAEKKAKQERAAREKALRAEHSKLLEELPTLYEKYRKALDAANKARGYEKTLFDQAERAQNRCLGATRRIRFIENQLQTGDY